MADVVNGYQQLLLTGLHYNINYDLILYGESGQLTGGIQFNIQVCPNVITPEISDPLSFDDAEGFYAPSYISGSSTTLADVDAFVSSMAASVLGNVEDFAKGINNEVTSVVAGVNGPYKIERVYQSGPTSTAVS